MKKFTIEFPDFEYEPARQYAKEYFGFEDDPISAYFLFLHQTIDGNITVEPDDD